MGKVALAATGGVSASTVGDTSCSWVEGERKKDPMPSILPVQPGACICRTAVAVRAPAVRGSKERRWPAAETPARGQERVLPLPVAVSFMEPGAGSQPGHVLWSKPRLGGWQRCRAPSRGPTGARCHGWNLGESRAVSVGGGSALPGLRLRSLLPHGPSCLATSAPAHACPAPLVPACACPSFPRPPSLPVLLGAASPACPCLPSPHPLG